MPLPKLIRTYGLKFKDGKYTGGGLSWRKKMVIIGLLLCITIVTPFLCLSLLQPEADNTKKEQYVLRRIVRSLNSIQAKKQNVLNERRKAANDIIKELLPWLPKNNTLPNYFFNNLVNHDSREYEKSNLVFLHHPRSAGTAVLDCLRNISMENNLPMSPLMDVDNVVIWESGDGDANIYREFMKIHRGRYSFGMCEKLKTPCSYFFMMRDPFERAVSSYYYCKSALGDELCSAINANRVSLRKWILEQGSILFRQVLFSSKFCVDRNDTFPFTPTNEDLVNKNNLPCWYKENIILEKLLDPGELKLVTNYVVSNLNKWFSVVGMVEKFEESMELFEHVFKLPFSKCNNRHKSETNGDVRVLTNRVSNQNSRRSDWLNPEEDDPEFLKNDVYIRDALLPDYAIYKEVKRIFSIQKQFYFNSFRS
ncbi:hypothetical protein ScPMuIL_007733 [Solemya velum]